MPQKKPYRDYSTVGRKGKRTVKKETFNDETVATKTTSNKRGVSRSKAVTYSRTGNNSVTKTKKKDGQVVKSKTKAIGRDKALYKTYRLDDTAKRDLKKGLKKEARQTKRAAMKKARTANPRYVPRSKQYNPAMGRDIPLPKSK